MNRIAMLIAVGLGLAVSVPAAAKDEVAVAVMEFASKGGIEQDQVDALGDMLANEIRAMGNFRVVGKSDIRAALQLEEQKQLLGCSDESCIAEIGGALGVRWMVVGNISLFGKTYLLNLKLIDVSTIKVASGVSRKVTGGEDKLLDALGQAARELIGAAREKMGLPAAAESKGDPAISVPSQDATPAAVATAAAPSSSKAKTYRTWGHITFWSGVGLTALGVVAVGMAKKTADDYRDSYTDHDPQVKAFNSNVVWSGLTLGSFSAGLALLTTGTVLWLLKPESDAEPPAAVPGIAPTDDGQGMVLSVGGRW